MRIWSLHPRYLDTKGLVALWRESLLAQAVLRGETRGYNCHPQLERFRQQTDPAGTIAAYLRAVQTEANERGYRFDATRIRDSTPVEVIPVTRGQIAYEWDHLLAKLAARAPDRWLTQHQVKKPAAHPLFQIVPGEIASWERRNGTS